MEIQSSKEGNKRKELPKLKPIICTPTGPTVKKLKKNPNNEDQDIQIIMEVYNNKKTTDEGTRTSKKLRKGKGVEVDIPLQDRKVGNKEPHISQMDDIYTIKVISAEESKARVELHLAIGNIFNLIEEATKGKWKRTPGQIEEDLYDVLQSFQLEKYEDSLYPEIYNLDVNYRQLFIYLSGVDGMIVEHALKCKHKYPNCNDVPNEHQEDMSCCK